MDFIRNLENTILFIGADKNTGFGKVLIEVVKNDEADFFKAPKIIEKIKNTEITENNYLYPAEIKEELCFSLVLAYMGYEKRMWEKDKMFLRKNIIFNLGSYYNSFFSYTVFYRNCLYQCKLVLKNCIQGIC